MIRGYIYVNTTATYKFNITSDDKSDFYLSTNDLPANKIRRAGVNNYTSQDEHYKEVGQTSHSITLAAGQNYYFEMYNYEGGGGDFMSLFWRKPGSADTTWRVIDYNNIKDFACGQNCPVRGTPCDDGNATTTDDKQDGFCNCVGKMPTANACVGDRGLAEAYYYDNIAGSYVEPDLINAPRFPLQPHRKEKLNGAYGPLETDKTDNYGTSSNGNL
jgi:GLEYA domain